jgi:hypothetical protein
MLAFCGTDAEALSKLKGIALVPLQRDEFAPFGQSQVIVGTPQEQVYFSSGGEPLRGLKKMEGRGTKERHGGECFHTKLCKEGQKHFSC